MWRFDGQKTKIALNRWARPAVVEEPRSRDNNDILIRPVSIFYATIRTRIVSQSSRRHRLFTVTVPIRLIYYWFSIFIILCLRTSLNAAKRFFFLPVGNHTEKKNVRQNSRVCVSIARLYLQCCTICIKLCKHFIIFSWL